MLQSLVQIAGVRVVRNSDHATAYAGSCGFSTLNSAARHEPRTFRIDVDATFALRPRLFFAPLILAAAARLVYFVHREVAHQEIGEGLAGDLRAQAAPSGVISVIAVRDGDQQVRHARRRKLGYQFLMPRIRNQVIVLS